MDLKQLLNDENLYVAFEYALRQVDELKPKDVELANDLKHLGLV